MSKKQKVVEQKKKKQPTHNKAKQNQSKHTQSRQKAGLSLMERKRLAELKRELAGKGGEQAKPTTAQKTITFDKMFRDGICQVTPKFYTKMVEFYDINYELLEVEDQADILEEYSKLINYFDPSIKFELFLFNRKVNEQAIADQFDIPLQGDEFDDIREEYAQMLKRQSAKGNNGVLKSKYIIFGTECVGFKEARSKLNNIEKDVIKNLNNIGTSARALDGKERLRSDVVVLHKNGQNTSHYVDSIGYRDVADFIKEQDVSIEIDKEKLEPKVSYYVIEDLATWKEQSENRSTLERFDNLYDAMAKFSQYKAETDEYPNDNARTTLGVGIGSVEFDILHVRQAENYLVHDFAQFRVAQESSQFLEDLQTIHDAIGFDKIRIHREMTPDEVKDFVKQRFEHQLKNGGIEDTSIYMNRFDLVYENGKMEHLIRYSFCHVAYSVL